MPASHRLRRRRKRAVSPIPLGADGLTACLIVKNVGDAIQFYKKAFGAKELLRIEAPWGTPNYELEHRG